MYTNSESAKTMQPAGARLTHSTYVDFAGLPGVPFNVLYVENQELTCFFSFKHGAGQNTATDDSL